MNHRIHCHRRLQNDLQKIFLRTIFENPFCFERPNRKYREKRATGFLSRLYHKKYFRLSMYCTKYKLFYIMYCL